MLDIAPSTSSDLIEKLIMYDFKTLPLKVLDVSLKKIKGRLEDSMLPQYNVDFEYNKFEWNRIPKLIFKLIDLLYRKTECKDPECSHLDKKDKLTTEAHINRHINSIQDPGYLENLKKNNKWIF